MDEFDDEDGITGSCTPYSLPERKEVGEHKHAWLHYDGCLGYESLVCRICGVDINELNEKDKRCNK